MHGKQIFEEKYQNTKKLEHFENVTDHILPPWTPIPVGAGALFCGVRSDKI